MVDWDRILFSLVLFPQKRYNEPVCNASDHILYIGGIITVENYDGSAVGIFELESPGACFVAIDAAAKAANVRIQNIERNRLGSGACVKMRGSVSDVTAAMDAALKVAEPLTKIFSHTIIASPAHETELAMYMTAGK